MLLAYTWAVGQVFLLTFAFFLFLLWIWLLIRVAIDVFKRHDLSGLGKAGWILALILFPIISVIVYMITNPLSISMSSVGSYGPSDAAIARQIKAAH
jgi:hypothetical protein